MDQGKPCFHFESANLAVLNGTHPFNKLHHLPLQLELSWRTCRTGFLTTELHRLKHARPGIKRQLPSHTPHTLEVAES